MSDQFEQSNSDASFEASSELPSTDSQQTQESAPAQAEAQKPEDSSTDFDQRLDKHPRFKELIEQKNQFSQRVQTYEKQLAEMQKRFEEMNKPKQEDPEAKQTQELMERLKGIDPTFAKGYQKALEAAKQVEQLSQWKQQYETQQFQQAAVSTVNSLHEANKLSPEIRDLYNAQLIAAERNGQIRSVDDVKAVYKQVHESMSKMFEARDRQLRESYVADKKKDASAPTAQSKGKPVNPNAPKQYSKDPGEARQQMVAEILAETRASKNVG